MALEATVYRFVVNVADSDRHFYETLDFRVARHPSESAPYLLTRVLAYCVFYEPGIAFSKGGVSSGEEPPLSVVDEQGRLRVWIDVGVPSAERLHRASKAAGRVVLFTAADLGRLRREARARPIHRAGDIEVYCIEPGLLNDLEPHVSAKSTWQLVRSGDALYIDVGHAALSGDVRRVSLAPE
jgi:uncharacterized protein YaeQ